MNSKDLNYDALYEALARESPRLGNGIPRPWLEAWEEIQTTLSPVAHRLQLVLDPDYARGYVLLYADGVKHRPIRRIPHRESYRLRQYHKFPYGYVVHGLWSPPKTMSLGCPARSFVDRATDMIEKGEVWDYDPFSHRWLNLSQAGKQLVGGSLVWMGGMLGFGWLITLKSWLEALGVVGMLLWGVMGIIMGTSELMNECFWH